jgi:hypothetical protein
MFRSPLRTLSARMVLSGECVSHEMRGVARAPFSNVESGSRRRCRYRRCQSIQAAVLGRCRRGAYFALNPSDIARRQHMRKRPPVQPVSVVVRDEGAMTKASEAAELTSRPLDGAR